MRGSGVLYRPRCVSYYATGDQSSAARTAPTPTLLTGGGSTTDATSFATASISPAADQPIYAAVISQATSVNTPTATGNGLTWVAVATGAPNASRKLTVFRSAGASPSAGAITFDFAGQTQSSAQWAVIQFASADITGTNGSGATVQAPAATTGTGVTSLAGPTLAALENSLNVNLTFVGLGLNTAVTNDALFAELSDAGQNTATLRLETQWAANQTVCTSTFSASDATAISIEVKAG